MANNRKKYATQECTYLNEVHSNLLKGESLNTGISKAKILKDLVKNHYDQMPIEKRESLISIGKTKKID